MQTKENDDFELHQVWNQMDLFFIVTVQRQHDSVVFKIKREMGSLRNSPLA